MRGCRYCEDVNEGEEGNNLDEVGERGEVVEELQRGMETREHEESGW